MKQFLKIIAKGFVCTMSGMGGVSTLAYFMKVDFYSATIPFTQELILFLVGLGCLGLAAAITRLWEPEQEAAA